MATTHMQLNEESGETTIENLFLELKLTRNKLEVERQRKSWLRNRSESSK